MDLKAIFGVPEGRRELYRLDLIGSCPSAVRRRFRRRKDEHKEGCQSMFPIGVLYAKVRREKYCGTMATLDGLTDGFHADPAKMFVMAYVGQLVRDGFAEWRVLENGHVELWLFSGEVFLLADATIARIM